MKPNLYKTIILAIILICIAGAAEAGKGAGVLMRTKAPENAVWLDGLVDGEMYMGNSMRESLVNGPLIVNGMIFPHGIGSFTGGLVSVDLKGAARGFMAMVGVDDFSWRKGGEATFEVWIDGEKAVSAGPLRHGDFPERVSVSLKDAQKLMLVVKSTEGSSMACDWGGALIVLDPEAGEKPEMAAKEDKSMPDIAHTDLSTPGIHGPRVVGSTPGKPFIFLVPATGEKPLRFSAEGLPEGLSLDPDTGIIEGSLVADVETFVTLEVEAANGSASRKLKIVGGKDRLALTPPMGWNSWNAWGTSVDEQKVRSAADAMVSSGLAQHGYTFVNIDDAWEGDRGEDGAILTNDKFPDMGALAGYVHSLGLKLGIYSSPGPFTCAKYEGSYEHEYQDAESFAGWGIDYLKYDWCGYRVIAKDDSRAEHMKPYKLMKKALDASDRDIVYSLCQYGMDNVWEWGAGVGGNLWRTTGDIVDTWGSMAGIGFGQDGLEEYSGPGHWNDPDMLVVGKVGWGPTLHPTRLTPNEQLTHITLWSMLAAPLLIGCDMADMDRFTLDILANTEVIDVNQDPLGKQGRKVAARDILAEIWARPLYDGTVAVALFNRFIEPQEITVEWADIGVEGALPVRNLWRRRDLGVFDGSFSIEVPAHGAALVRIGTPEPGEWGE